MLQRFLCRLSTKSPIANEVSMTCDERGLQVCEGPAGSCDLIGTPRPFRVKALWKLETIVGIGAWAGVEERRLCALMPVCDRESWNEGRIETGRPNEVIVNTDVQARFLQLYATWLMLLDVSPSR